MPKLQFSLVAIARIAATIVSLCPAVVLASPPEQNPPLDFGDSSESQTAAPVTEPVPVPPPEPEPVAPAEPPRPAVDPHAHGASEPGVLLPSGAIAPTEKEVRDAQYEAQFAVPAAPTVPNPPGRQNVFNLRIKNHEWDAMEIINTDRPDFTDVLPTVKKYMWQTESGYSFSVREQRNGEEKYAYHRHRGPETLLRYGLTERLELRVRWDSAWYTHQIGNIGRERGMAFSGDLLVGVKWQGILQDGWRPAHSFMATLVARGADGGVVKTGLEPGFNWIYGWQIVKAWVIRGSTGFEYVVTLPQRPNQNDEAPTGGRRALALHQSVVTYVQWVPRLGTYTEWFAFFDFGEERGNQHNVGQGFYIYITPNVQIDLRVVGTVFAQGERPRDLSVGSGLSLRGFYHKRQREQSKRAEKRETRRKNKRG